MVLSTELGYWQSNIILERHIRDNRSCLSVPFRVWYLFFDLHHLFAKNFSLLLLIATCIFNSKLSNEPIYFAFHVYFSPIMWVSFVCNWSHLNFELNLMVDDPTNYAIDIRASLVQKATVTVNTFSISVPRVIHCSYIPYK